MVDRSRGLPDVPIVQPDGRAGGAALVDLRSALSGIIGNLNAHRDLLITVNDPQRHTDTPAVLRSLADLCRVAGPGRWRLLVACGTHRFDAHLREMFERNLLATGAPIQSIDWHDCRDSSLRPVCPGAGWRAHPLLSADDAPMVTIGSVEPHYFAGLTGAHKTATIGVAAAEAVEVNHAGAMAPEAAPFMLVGNPVFEGVRAMLADVEVRRPVVAVNVLQTGATIRAVEAGDPIETLEQLAPQAAATFSCTLDAPADALILEVTGPLAVSFYQADKAIKNAEDAVAAGGLLILEAACDDGIGQDHFVALMRQAPTHAAALRVVGERGYRLGDHKAVRLRRLTDPSVRNVRIAAVSDGLDVAACQSLGMRKAPTVTVALAEAGVDVAKARVFRVPDAANTVVRVR